MKQKHVISNFENREDKWMKRISEAPHERAREGVNFSSGDALAEDEQDLCPVALYRPTTFQREL